MRLVFGTVFLAAGTIVAPASHAQDEDAIVVTATRAPAVAERLPARVETIDRDDIEAQALATLAAAIGAEAVQSGGAGQQASLFLRGASSKHALALLDGVRLNDASAPNAQYDFGQDTLGGLDRVEVLRGPASAIYGSDAVGGVVNLLPRRGGGTAYEPFLEASAGSFGTFRALAGAAGTSGGLDYGFSAERLETGGFDQTPDRIVTHTGDPDGAAVSTLTASARHAGDVFAVDALLRVRESEAEFDTFSGGPFFDLRADDPDLENEALQTLWRLGAEATAGAMRARLSGGQVASERAEADGGLEVSSADSTRTYADAAAYFGAGASTLTAGLSFERNSIDTATPFASPLSAAEEQWAAYLIGQAGLGEHVAVTAAARLDEYEAFGAQATYGLGLVVDLGWARLFASSGTAFKAPSLSERYETSMFNVGNPDLDPEESQSWEIGADWTLTHALRAGASYYQTRIEDLIEYDFLELRNINVGEADIDGAEAYVEARPAPWATLRAEYAWTDAVNAATGARLQRRPEHLWRLDARITPARHVTLAASWAYVGERTDVTYGDDGAFLDPAGRVASFTVAALAATFDLNDRVQVFARIDNIADEVFEQPAAFAGAPRSATFGVRAAY